MYTSSGVSASTTGSASSDGSLLASVAMPSSGVVLGVVRVAS